MVRVLNSVQYELRRVQISTDTAIARMDLHQIIARPLREEGYGNHDPESPSITTGFDQSQPANVRSFTVQSECLTDFLKLVFYQRMMPLYDDIERGA